MTSFEFAQKMGVSYHVVMAWLRLGIVPGATKRWDGKAWDIPEAALTMERPSRRSYLTEEGKRLKTELLELNQRHTKLLEDYASLRGRYDHLVGESEHTRRSLEDQLELAEAQIKTLQEIVDEDTSSKIDNIKNRERKYKSSSLSK